MDLDYKNLIIAPPYTHLKFFKMQNLASQDFSLKKGTSYITLEMISDLVKYCIIGHVELNESRETVYKKAELLLEKNLTPIMCSTSPVNDAQFVKNKNIIVAYENPSNIGNGKVIDTTSLQNIAKEFKTLVDNTLLYGGSIDSENFRRLAQTDINGFLIGGASLDLDSLTDILKGCDL